MTNWNNNEIKLEAIRNLYKTNSTAKAAFDYFARCQRNKQATKVNRLLSVLLTRGHNIAYWEVRDFLRELGRLNCGQYKIGRRGQPSRLEWSVGLTSLGQAATGQSSEIAKLTEEEARGENDEIESDASAPVAPGPLDMKVSFPLRRDQNVDIVLPKDITATEAYRLGEFIKTLPFEQRSVAA